MAMVFLDGNEATALAAVRAGCRFFAGYPITPATPIYHHLLKMLPPKGGVCLQGEDEIASIGFCLGASMAGLKAMTATSGPGISLYSEQISFAIGGEIPLVIVDVQRLGPSTGSATKGADGDIQFLRWSNSGGLPVIVLAPVDVADCYTLTVHAFNLSERFRCPVFLASNKETAMTRESVDLASLQIPTVVSRNHCPPDREFLPFGPGGEKDVPYFLPLGGDRLVRQTSSTHDEYGYITGDTETIARGIRRMENKLLGAINSLSLFEYDRDESADTLLIVYGVTARAAREAVQRIRDAGGAVSLLILKTLFPVPEKTIQRCIADAERVMVIEMNLGQYVREIERLAGSKPVEFHGRMDGKLISPAAMCKVMGL